MSETVTSTPKIGTVAWQDLTVPNAAEVREFYEAVIGWVSSPVSMGEYNDFNMAASAAEAPAAGICHARGGNANLPAQWLLYFVVKDLDASLRACLERGGTTVTAPREAGSARYCVIKDPAGAVCALYQP